MTRVRVFVDYQNVYMSARRAFGLEHGAHMEGQIKPLRLGLLLTERRKALDPSRKLDQVHLFRGEPSPKHSPGGFAACQRQVAEWDRVPEVVPTTRPLKYYPSKWSNGQPVDFVAREKGIDVLLALAMVVGAVRDEFDVAVLFSADTDLLPALEQVHAAGKQCETVGWKPPNRYASRLRDPSGGWCHYLNEADYQLLRDDRNYL